MSLLNADLPKALRERAEHSITQLRAAVSEYKNVCYANSLGSESMVLTDLIWEAVPEIDIFSIDTGRLYPETYDLIERVQQRYGRALRIYYPDAAEVEHLGDQPLEPFRLTLRGREQLVAVRGFEVAVGEQR